MSMRASAVRPISMRLLDKIRALMTLVMLAAWSPVGVAIENEHHASHLATSLFVARRTRIAAAEQFDPAMAAIATRRPSRDALGAVAVMTFCETCRFWYLD
jgi:hypothetical protein